MEVANNTEEEIPEPVEEETGDQRSLPAPFFAGIVSLVMASLIVELRLSRQGEQDE